MEKTLYNQVGEVKGKISAQEESFSFQFTPQNENLRATRGALFTLVTLKSEEENKVARATAFYQAFQSSYYAKSGGSIIKSLSDTLDGVNKDFNEKAAGAEHFSLIAAVLWGSVLYLAKLGESSVFIARGGRIKKLDFSKVASGVLENQDTVCLTSDSFEKTVDQEELGKLLNQEKFEKILEAVDKKIGDLEGATCVVVRLSVDQPETEEEKVAIAQVEESGDIVKEEETPLETEEIENGEKEDEDEQDKDKAVKDKEEEPPSVNIGGKEVLGEKVKEIYSQVSPLILEKLTVVKNSLAKPWKKRKPGELVDHVAVRRQRIMQIVGLIVVVLVVSIGFTLLGQGKKATDAKFNSLVSDAKGKMSQAANLKTIDPAQAKQLTDGAGNDIEQAKKLEPKNAQISDLENQQASLLAEITKAYKVDLTTAADLSKLVSKAAVTRMTLSDSEIKAIDSGSAEVYSLDITSSNTTKIDTTLLNPTNIASFDSGYYIQDNQGVYKLDKSGKLTNLTTNAGWGEISGAASFQNNLYLVDKGKGEIWKYFALGFSLSGARTYLSGDKPDLSQAVGIAIDGYVWVVTKNGNLYKISQGKKMDFAITNMLDSFGAVADIFTSPDTNNLYLLDSGKSRVVVIGKDGAYQAQYGNTEIKNATSLVAQESKKLVYLGIGGKVVSFNLR